MECPEYRTALASYAMAALDPAETAVVAAHLEGCAACRAELAEVEAVTEAMALLSHDEAMAALAPQDLDGARDAATGPAPATVNGCEVPDPPVTGASTTAPSAGDVARPRVPRQARGAVARTTADDATGEPGTVPATAPGRGLLFRARWGLAAGVAGILLGTGVGVVVGGSDSGQEVSVQAGPVAAGTALPAVRAADATTGVRAEISPVSTGWGTQTTLRLTGVKGPQSCRLTVVSKDGTRQTALTWAVPPKGYGLPGSPKKELVVTGGVSIPSGDVAAYEVETDEGRRLVRVPA
ncbi:Putative zinc-finger [Actinacidiphila alni]|uniref:Putative zinc-finger n=1 Tax=Actinacidiphila alni TaxID=380248 RepID=A0A1I2LU38_9ACTN|nr:zf-HC2 domain-containing protein [Actinacidiphila alni]SFF81910.1 Putative zinc-finger [Actinacidiphila alni]